ncbi:DEAD/DEAH box helicase [Kocuria sp. cx-455]|uniref:DEAD/DEAH box helicase n=1 Tax=Kocuria sp. cx-455 TaxID=2771377 RepID=UPI003D706073
MSIPAAIAPRLHLTRDQAIIDQISREFGLRPHNTVGLRVLIDALAGDYDPAVPQVMDMCTGSGKTYLMAGFIEYLRRQGIRHVMVVTPSTVVQAKTVQNFTPGTRRHISGAAVEPQVTTPQDYSAWRAAQTAPGSQLFRAEEASQLFVFNIQQLIAPREAEGETQGAGVQATQRRIRRFDETSGNLFEYLRDQEDLVVFADESHLYGAQAKAFHQAIKDLQPAATVGLTASASKNDHVVFRYPLWQAIADGMVKTPVIAYRASGYPEIGGEELQLQDALVLLRIKQDAYKNHVLAHPHSKKINPVLFVVCADVSHATDVAQLLRTPAYLGSDDAVLQVDNTHDDALTQQRLEDLDQPYSTVRAVVSVNKLKEGWDVKSIAVMVTLRALASETLTQQTIGRGLRLPFGAITGDKQVDTLDILSHASVKAHLSAEKVLKEFGLEKAVTPEQRKTRPVPVPPSALTAGRQDAISPDESEDAPGTGGDQPAESGIGLPNVRFVEINDDTDLDRTVRVPEREVVRLAERYRNAGGFHVRFPRVTMARTVPPLNLAEIADETIRYYARKVHDPGDVLEREQVLVNTLKTRLRLRSVEQANVESTPVSFGDVALELERAALTLQALPRTQDNHTLVRAIVVPTFLREANTTDWTVKSLASATGRIRDMLTQVIRDHEATARTSTTVASVDVPHTWEITLPSGDRVHEQIDDRTRFKVRRWYGGWSKNVFVAARFDSYSGEYALAQVLDKSQDINWWLRLERQDGASIAYTPRNTYYPDFLALDTDGVHWIIEGKNDAGEHDETVQAKRTAAQRHIRELLTVPEFADQRWGYLIAYETEVQKAASWRDLVSSSSPVVTP